MQAILHKIYPSSIAPYTDFNRNVTCDEVDPSSLEKTSAIDVAVEKNGIMVFETFIIATGRK